jgi:tRNA threonylcarbamoyl adenosine modification protein YeaZ
LRVGIAAARGLGLAAGKPVVGLSTLSAFAAPFLAADASLPVVVAIDARHDHVYLQVWASGGEVLITPCVVPIAEAVRLSAVGAPCLTGNAANILAAAWRGVPPSAVEQRAAPDIDWLARAGAAMAEEGSPPKPLYLRPPDAQPQTAARLARR